jgi:hypothetical protein
MELLLLDTAHRFILNSLARRVLPPPANGRRVVWRFWLFASIAGFVCRR